MNAIELSNVNYSSDQFNLKISLSKFLKVSSLVLLVEMALVKPQ